MHVITKMLKLHWDVSWGNLFDTEEMTFPLLSTLLFLMLDLSSNDEIEDKLLQS